MPSFVPQMISILLWSFLFVTLVVFGLFFFSVQQIPHYQEIAQREIQTSGGLSNATIAKIEKEINHGQTATHTQATDPQGNSAQQQAETNANQNKVVIDRAVKNSDGTWRRESYAEYAKDSPKQPYGTKVHYVITYAKYATGGINMARTLSFNTTTTLVRGALSDMDMPVTDSSLYGGNATTLTTATGTLWGGLAVGIGGGATNYAVISHNQGIFMRMGIMVDQDSTLSMDINNSKPNSVSNDNDDMNMRTYDLFDANGNQIDPNSVLKANQQYTYVVKYYNDNRDNISIQDQQSTLMIKNPDGSQPASRTVTFNSFGYSIINMDGTPATINGNLVADGQRLRTGTGDNIFNGNLNGTIAFNLANGETVDSLSRKVGLGNPITFSYDYYMSGSSISGSFTPQWWGQPWDLGASGATVPVSSTNKSGHVTITGYVNSSWLGNNTNAIMIRTDNLVGQLSIYNFKAEVGSTATNSTNNLATLPNGNPNLLQNSTGINASNSSRPSLDNQLTSSPGGDITYGNYGIHLKYTGNGSQEWYYAITETEWTGDNFSRLPSLTAGKTYTVSADVRGTVPQAVFRIGNSNAGELGTPVNINNNSWTKVSYTFTLKPNITSFWLRLNGANNNTISAPNIFNQTQELVMANFKLEEGTAVTP